MLVEIVQIVCLGILGLAQGIRRIFVQFGLILGPLWAGSMFSQPYYMFGVMLSVNLLLMASIMLIFLIYLRNLIMRRTAIGSCYVAVLVLQQY